ncbi:sugar-binding domain-containing protein [Gorillibacterium sp. sgz5001074]|uniref:sugar-binding domain-containing protein n=1 Tax=Gorillibacterium sp. sgz5001074 TaxID=3446695 RepID=UPI003F66271E
MEKVEQDQTVLRLDGSWAYALDPEDAGETEEWYGESGLPHQEGTLRLPGTLAGNGIGQQTVWNGEMNRESVRSLRQHHRYVGAAWYSCELAVPDHWAGKRVVLFLERVMFQSTLWINGRLAGRQDSLSVPHRFDVTAFIRTGAANRVTIRIDNRDLHKLGGCPSAYTDETQTIWNGMIGRLEMQATDRVYTDSIRFFPDIENRKVKVTGRWINPSELEASATLTLTAQLVNGTDSHRTDGMPYGFTLPPNSSNSYELVYDMGEEVRLWDEFQPAIYEMQILTRVVTAEGSEESERRHRFGMRSFRQAGNRFEINGRPAFLRGTLECCIFPLTGHPPADTAPWLHLFQTAKDYGLNHIRFHSWCPPEAAFDAADQLGIYIQAEGPVWMDTWNMPVGAHPEHYDYLPEEAKRIVDEYGNHPSFCLFSNGNELNGDFGLLHRIVAALKEEDDRRLYTLTTNWDRPLDPADDWFCAQTVDGAGVRGQFYPDEWMVSTLLDFREAVEKREVPLISHEVGQYAVYPDVDEINRYTGDLRPVNLEAIRTDLERRGLLGYLRKFVHGSGKLALQLYREEIEAALRTPGMGGFQLLGLHDFPGQSTATVGILNSLWESKGLIEPEAFRAFCRETVLLLRIPKRIYTTDEGFRAQVDIAHFGPEALPASDWQWSIRSEAGRRLDHGVLRAAAIGQGSGIPIGAWTSDVFHRLERSEKLTVSIEGPGGQYRNEWPVWVFKDSEEGTGTAHDGLLVTDTWNEAAEQALAEGGSVLFLVTANISGAVPGAFLPVFWSPVHFSTENPCGIWVQADHPVFTSFPTETYAEPQWKDLLDRSVSLCLDGFPLGIEPIVQVIPNFYHNRKLSNLLECRVGNGKLMICGIDLTNELETRPAARQLRRSIFTYMKTEAFEPEILVTVGEVRKLLRVQGGAADGTNG